MTGSQYFSLSDVARILGVRAHRISYQFMSQQLPEPQRLGGRRMFKWDEIIQIAEKLGRPIPPHDNGGAK